MRITLFPCFECAANGYVTSLLEGGGAKIANEVGGGGGGEEDDPELVILVNYFIGQLVRISPENVIRLITTENIDIKKHKEEFSKNIIW